MSVKVLPAKNLDRTSESGIVAHVLRKAYAGSMIFQPISMMGVAELFFSEWINIGEDIYNEDV